MREGDGERGIREGEADEWGKWGKWERERQTEKGEWAGEYAQLAPWCLISLSHSFTPPFSHPFYLFSVHYSSSPHPPLSPPRSLCSSLFPSVDLTASSLALRSHGSLLSL